jgi:antitoxin component YwqK of YwqJK toxin-antitoxin module
MTSISCQEEKSEIDIQLNELDINPSNFQNIDTLNYSSGNIESLTFYKSKDKYYKITFYENGSKKQLYQIKNDQFHGKAIDWFKNGKKEWIREYDNGNLIGKNITFQENGFKKQDFDTENKTTILFFENGSPRVKYSDMSTIFYYDNGNKFEEYNHQLDSRNEYSGAGKVKFYSENNELIFDGLYNNTSFSQDGKKITGKIVCYFNNGKPSMFFNLKNGYNVGEYYCYHGNGNLKFEGETIDSLDVYYKSYYPNGNPEFEQDKRKNIEKRWDENGNLIK